MAAMAAILKIYFASSPEPKGLNMEHAKGNMLTDFYVR